MSIGAPWNQIELVLGSDAPTNLWRGSVVAFVIKVAAAGLQLVMFLGLARVMNGYEFGWFGFAFSLATLLAVAGSFGQRMLVVRFVPIYLEEQKRSLANGVIRFGYLVVSIGSLLVGVFLYCVGINFFDFDDQYVRVTAFFAFVLAIAEYQSHVLRALGRHVLSLLPRDVIWRGSVIVLTWVASFRYAGPFTATNGLMLITTLLAATVLAQGMVEPATRPWRVAFADAQLNLTKWFGASVGLWGVAVVGSAAPNLAVVLSGVFLQPESTGSFFATLRTTMLLNLYILAADIVVAPIIARLTHSRRLSELQRLVALISWITLILASLTLVFLLLIGVEILSSISPSFDVSKIAMAVLAMGFLIQAAAGQGGLIMAMSGAERSFFLITLCCNAISIFSIALLTPLLGVTGAALGVAFSFAGRALVCRYWSVRYMKVEPSILGLWSGTRAQPKLAS